MMTMILILSLSSLNVTGENPPPYGEALHLPASS